MLGGYELTQVLAVVAELGIADRLAEGPKDVEQLAREVDAHAPSLHRLLHAAASLGVVSLDGEGRVVLAPSGERLRSDVPDSLHPFAVAYGQAWWWDAWGELRESVRTGSSGFELAHGDGLYDYAVDHPDFAAVYGNYMYAMTQLEAEAILAACDLGGMGTVVDVGGGQGALIEAILRTHRQTRGIVLDTSDVIERCQERMRHSDVHDRVELVAGNFFESVPSGGDVYILRNVVHDWDDESAIRILTTCRRAMGTSATLVVAGYVIPEDGKRARATMMDLALLVLTGGRERTEQQYRSLLESSGFSLREVIPTAVGATVLVSDPV
jgi:hypothetical protein